MPEIENDVPPGRLVNEDSVSIEFDASQLQGGNGRFGSRSKKIKRVEVIGEGINFAEDTSNKKVTVKVYYGNR